jgi:5-dehydro-4-deoxyglucarate dehydratase
MRPEELRPKLTGVIAFPITPFKPDLSLDLVGLRKNLRELIRHPLAAIVAAGGTGELYSLTPSEHLLVVSAIAEEVNGKIPVIGGTGFNYPIGMELAKQAAAAGTDAILALPPYYPNSDDNALLEYYAAIGNATPLPLFVYSRDWLNPTPSWVEKLATRVPTLIAGRTGKVTYDAISRSFTASATGCTGSAVPVTTAYPAITASAFALTLQVSRPWPQSFHFDSTR